MATGSTSPTEEFHEVEGGLYVADLTDTTGWTADRYKSKRAGTKASLTRKVNELLTAIRRKERRAAINVLRQQLAEKLENCRFWHTTYVILSPCPFLPEDQGKHDTWIQEAEDQAAAVESSAAQYIESRKGQASESSVTSSKAAANKRREAERIQKETVIRVEEEKRKVELDMKKAAAEAKWAQERTELEAKLKLDQLDITLFSAQRRTELAKEEEEQESIRNLNLKKN